VLAEQVGVMLEMPWFDVSSSLCKRCGKHSICLSAYERERERLEASISNSSLAGR